MDALEDMARNCFGYGQWEAPYWFIGLEEGMSGKLEDRIKTFQRMRKDGLSGCKDFHNDIEVYKHHHQRPPLEPTWRVLMLVLLTYLGRDSSRDAQKDYQAERLGMANDETALLALFGLPVRELKAGFAQRGRHLSPELLDNIHAERISVLRQKLVDHGPELVMMYGSTKKGAFGELAGQKMNDWDIIQRGSTIMTLAPHPTARGVTNARWTEHAKALRQWKERHSGS